MAPNIGLIGRWPHLGWIAGSRRLAPKNAAAVRDFAKSYEQDAEREEKRDPFKD